LEAYATRLGLLQEAGIAVVLNVLGGLPEQTVSAHEATVGWLTAYRDLWWLCNLYNFVPYPLTPDFPRLRPRIHDWDFSHWREDAPPVFHPFHLSAAESWDLFEETITAVHAIVRAHADTTPVAKGAR